MKFIIDIEEILIGQRVIEADTLERALEILDHSREDAGSELKPLETESFVATVQLPDEKRKVVRWI